MKVLIVAFYYPPVGNTGSRRVGGTAEHLARIGHDVRVLTGLTKASRTQTGGGSEAVPVLRTRWIGPPLPTEWTGGPSPAAGVSERHALERRTRVALRSIYRSCVYMPDPYVGWYPFAVTGVMPRLRAWRPDVVLSSAYPLTSIMVGHHLAGRCAAPHVVELRDLWTGNPYRPRPAWARPIDRALESHYLGAADGLVTVSEELARTLRGKYPAPVLTVYHGFEPLRREPRPHPAATDRRLRLVYTGSLHDGRRDPLPLLRAMKTLQREGVLVGFDYYGPDSETVRRRLTEAGDPEDVRVMGVVPNEQAVSAQMDADVLVLLMWDHPNEAGSVTGKLFEYIGAGRPVLVVGAPHSAAARLVAENGLGHASTSQDDALSWLRAAAAAKSEGRLQAVDAAVVGEFSRQRQVERLSSFLTARVADRVT